MERIADTGVTPKALENRPILMVGLDFYLNAFQDLKFDRQIGMSVGLIPWSSIAKWAEVHGIGNADDIAILEFHIRKLEYTEYKHNQKEKPKAKGNK